MLKDTNLTLKKVVAGVFFYTLASAWAFQFLVLPLMPSLHAGLGLLKGDNIVFHHAAVAIAEQVQRHGWGEIPLYHLESGGSVNVSVLSALYALFGPHPWLALPINALLHALAAGILFDLVYKVSKDRFAAALACLCFAVFPVTLIWTAQVHKDGYAVLAWFGIFHAVAMAYVLPDFRRTALMALPSLALFILVRPFYLHLVCLMLLLNLCIAIGLWAGKRVSSKSVAVSLGLLIAAAGMNLASKQVAVKPEARLDRTMTVAQDAERDGQVMRPGCNMFIWRGTELPVLAPALKIIASIRTGQICRTEETSDLRSLVDADVFWDNQWSMAVYFPRAVELSLFFPHPAQLLRLGNAKGIMGLWEMLVYYFAMAFVIWGLVKRRVELSFVTLLILGITCSIFLAYISPVMGSFHRIRYPFFTIILSVGIVQFLRFFRRS